MKLTINSINMALWVEGPLSNFSRHTLEKYEDENPDYYDYMISLGGTPKGILDAVFSDEFPFGEQIRFLSAMNTDAHLFKYLINNNEQWMKVRELTEHVVRMRALMPPDFDPSNHGLEKQTDERIVTLPQDAVSYAMFAAERNLLAMASTALHYLEHEQANLPDVFTQYELVGHMCYHYAKDGLDILLWNKVAILLSVAMDQPRSLGTEGIVDMIRELFADDEELDQSAG